MMEEEQKEPLSRVDGECSSQRQDPRVPRSELASAAELYIECPACRPGHPATELPIHEVEQGEHGNCGACFRPMRVVPAPSIRLKELGILIENLQDALLKYEWVRSIGPNSWHCHLCGGKPIEHGGDDHAEGCEWQRLVGTPTDLDLLAIEGAMNCMPPSPFCSCCVCHGIHCLLPHPGHWHGHSSEENDILAELAETLRQQAVAKDGAVSLLGDDPNGGGAENKRGPDV